MLCLTAFAIALLARAARTGDSTADDRQTEQAEGAAA